MTLTKTQKYTYDGVASNPKITETDYQYDTYGNPTKISELGDTSVTGDERYTYNDYATNPAVWIVNKLAHTSLVAADNTTKVSESWDYYDGATPAATPTPTPTPTPAFSLNDKTSNGNNLSNNGGVTASTSTPFAGGNAYSAVLTKSSAQYLSVASAGGSSLDVNGNITIEMWVKFSSLPSNALWGLTTKWSPGGDSYLFGINDSGGTKTLQFWVSAGSTSSSPITVTTGTWTYFAVTFNNSTKAVTFYQSTGGTPMSVGSGIAPGNMTSTAGLFQIGAWDLANTLDATVDDVRVWNTTRTSTQLSNSYNSKLVGNESGLVGYFPFETP